MTSTRCMPWEWSSSVITFSAMAGDVKLGQPVPASNFASDANSAAPEGACKGDVCVPLPDGVRVDDGRRLRLDQLAERIGAPLVHDEERGLYAIGPSTVSGRALATAEAPELELPDLNGNPFKLSSLR